MQDAQAAGCIALRRVDAETGEVKRLWVRPAFRASGPGRALAARIISEAREAGYARLILDTLGTMALAMALYRSLGFRDIAPYDNNPLPGVVYMGLELAAWRSGETFIIPRDLPTRCNALRLLPPTFSSASGCLV